MKTIFVLTGVAALCGFSYAAKGISEVPEVHESSSPEALDGNLKLMTLNIAHGRGVSFHQLFMRQRSLKKNLDKINDVLLQEKPDIVALQESDARTFYSNNLHQSQYLCDKSKMAQSIQGRHVKGMNFIYGTALLSKSNISNPQSVVFPFKAPNPTKGLVIGTVKVKDLDVDVISVHLDFMHKKLRKRQVNIIAEHVESRNRPTLIMGDFNCQWSDKSALKSLCDRLNLKAWNPNENTSTFPKTKKRLDWILIPNNFEFKSYRVLEQRVSDHLGVVAEVQVK